MEIGHLQQYVFINFKKLKILNLMKHLGNTVILEDLDFSLNLMKTNKKIYLSSEAKFLHPENIDRSSFKFGITEIIK